MSQVINANTSTPQLAWLEDGFVHKLIPIGQVKELGNKECVLYTKYDRLAVGVESAKAIPLETLEKLLESAEGIPATVDINLTR